MTESSPVALLTPIDMPASKHGSCGILIPNTNARIMDLEKEVPLGPNHAGELQIKGPQVFILILLSFFIIIKKMFFTLLGNDGLSQQ